MRSEVSARGGLKQRRMSARRRACFPVTSRTSGDAVRWILYACTFCVLLVLRSSARRGVEIESSKYTQTQDFGHKSRTRETVVWSTDLHAGPIGCQVSMFATLNIDVEAEVDVPNCKYFQNGRGENLCASGRVFETIEIVDFLSTLTRTTRGEDYMRTLVRMEILRARMSCFVRTRRRTAKYIYRLINQF